MSQIVNPNLCRPEMCSIYPGVKTNYISITLPDVIKYLGLNLDKQLNRPEIVARSAGMTTM